MITIISICTDCTHTDTRNHLFSFLLERNMAPFQVGMDLHSNKKQKKKKYLAVAVAGVDRKWVKAISSRLANQTGAAVDDDIQEIRR